jgi:hypothetical protein
VPPRKAKGAAPALAKRRPHEFDLGRIGSEATSGNSSQQVSGYEDGIALGKKLRPSQRHRSEFVLTLRNTRPGADSIRGLRAVLKSLLRRHGFRCTAAREVSNPTLMRRRQRRVVHSSAASEKTNEQAESKSGNES